MRAATIVVVLAGCAPATAPPPAVPVVVAEPVAPEAVGLDPTAPPTASTPGPTPAPSVAPSTDPSPSTAPDETAAPADDTAAIGPTSADAAAFVRSDALADLAGLEHVVVDLDGDTWAEVVATGTVDRAGRLRVAWWTADGYEVLASDVAGPGTTVTDLRASDLNRDGLVDVLVRVEGDGRRSLSLWTVPRRGALQPLAAVGGCHDGSNVYGVTRARLEARDTGAPAIVADCDDSPLPVADWSEQRWVWTDGAYRLEAAVPAPPPRGEDDVDDDEDDEEDEDDD